MGTQLQAPAAYAPQTPSDVTHRGWFRHVGWVVLLAANLPLAFVLGWDTLKEPGRVGMVTAVVCVWLLGHLVVRRNSDLADVILPGSVCTALLQLLFPWLHVFCGVFALGVAITIDPFSSTVRLSPVGGFVAALLTAAQLVGVAWVCGWVLRATWLALANRIRQA